MLKLFVALAVVLAPIKWIYVVDENICNGCGNCFNCCPFGAISEVGGKAYIDPDLCRGCGICPNYCSRNAIYRDWYTGVEDDTVTTGMVPGANPAFGSLTVSGAEPSAEVKLMDLAGRLLVSSEADESGDVSLDISGLAPGIYLIVSGRYSIALTVAGTI